MPKRVIAAGEEWLGVLCSNSSCGLPIALFKIRPGQASVDVQHSGPFEVTCQSCGNKSTYQPTQIQGFRAVDKGRLS